MELQFHKSTIRTLGTAAHEVKKTELTQEVRLSDGMPDIGRVLVSWGQVILRSKEWQGDTASVTGGVMVWILYMPEDGTEPRSVEAWLPFQLKWELENADREGIIRFMPLLRFVDSRSVSARKFMVRTGISAMGQALFPMDAQIYNAGELPEDIEILKNTYPVRIPKEAGEKTFVLDEDVTVPDNIPSIEKLLSFTVRPEIADKKVMANKAVFKGRANLHLVYRAPEGKVTSWDMELPFSQYTDLDSSYGNDAQVDVQMGVTSLEADASEPGKLRIKCGMVGQYLIDEQERMELTEDAYSPFRDVSLETEALNLPIILENRKENVTAEQAIQGQTGEAVDVNFMPDFPRQRWGENGVELEIPALFQVLYYGEDGTLQSANARWEGSVNLPASENVRVNAQIQGMGNPGAVQSMDGMQLNGQMQLGVTSVADQDIPMVTGLQLGELQEPDPARPSMVVCRPDGEALWQIAKRCGSTVAAIREANGLLEEPARDRMLLIPVS